MGTELDLDDPMCQECKFQTRCQSLYGRRANRVRLSKAKFKLLPPRLEEIREKIEDPDDPDLEATYRQCHMAVFDRMPEDKISRNSRASAAIRRLARELNCSLKVSITTVMMAHREVSPDRQFYSMMLSGPKAESRIKMYRDACRRKFGFFDVSAIDTLTKTETFSLEDKLLTSETVFGEFVVGYKMRIGGEPFTEFYRIREQALDPTWLAIEPTYQDVLTAHLRDPGGTHLIRRHRHAVIQAQRALKLNKGQAIHTFQLREKTMAKAMEIVLSRKGFKTSHFLVESPITDAGKVWSRLGTAIQHIHLLRWLDGDEASASELMSY